MNKISWKVWIGIILIVISVFFYLLHFVIFRDSHHIFVFMLHDIAFVPLEVLLVTLIIERLLHEREKLALLKKLNMLIGAFFSEAGSHLLKSLTGFIQDKPLMNSNFSIQADWTDKDFERGLHKG